MPIYVAKSAFSELRPGSNERYENSTVYGPFSFFIYSSLYFIKNNFIISVVNTDKPFNVFFL